MMIITNDVVEYVRHHPQDLYHHLIWEWDADSLNISLVVVKITIIMICNDRKIHDDESRMTMICVLIMISKIIVIIITIGSEPRINWTFLWSGSTSVELRDRRSDRLWIKLISIFSTDYLWSLMRQALIKLWHTSTMLFWFPHILQCSGGRGGCVHLESCDLLWNQIVWPRGGPQKLNSMLLLKVHICSNIHSIQK